MTRFHVLLNPEPATVKNGYYPEVPGHKDDDDCGTGAQAARAIRGAAKLVREKIMVQFAAFEMTPDECAQMIGENAHTVRSRFSELGRAGRIIKTPGRRKNASGLYAHVWTLNQRSIRF